jgi:hypothetical protein
MVDHQKSLACKGIHTLDAHVSRMKAQLQGRKCPSERIVEHTTLISVGHKKVAVLSVS